MRHVEEESVDLKTLLRKVPVQGSEACMPYPGSFMGTSDVVLLQDLQSLLEDV